MVLFYYIATIKKKTFALYGLLLMIFQGPKTLLLVC